MRTYSGFAFLLSLMIVASCTHDPPTGGEVFVTTPYEIDRPYGMPPVPEPAEALTVEGVRLGRDLFYDPILSADSTLSCAGCHQLPGLVDTEMAFSLGIDGLPGLRNSMPIFNMIYNPDFGETPEGRPFGGFFWDSRAPTLKVQVLDPIEDPLEMHHTVLGALASLRAHEEYPTLFYEAFGDSVITPDQLSSALAMFIYSITSGNTLFDQMNKGDIFWDDEVLDGFILFNEIEGGDCFHCHGENGGMFTDYTYRNNGLDSVFNYLDFEDPGLGAISGDTSDYGKFKVPTLRNIALTAPYMHDGRFATLEEVLDFYSTGVHATPFTDGLMEFADEGGVNLTEEEKQKIIAFLEALTDTELATKEEYSNPF